MALVVSSTTGYKQHPIFGMAFNQYGSQNYQHSTNMVHRIISRHTAFSGPQPAARSLCLCLSLSVSLSCGVLHDRMGMQLALMLQSLRLLRFQTVSVMQFLPLTVFCLPVFHVTNSLRFESHRTDKNWVP